MLTARFVAKAKKSGRDNLLIPIFRLPVILTPLSKKLSQYLNSSVL